MQNFSYKLIEDGTYAVVGYNGDEPHVVIPEDVPVTVLFDKLFQGHSEIETVRIPSTVTDIGEFVFDGCTALRSIQLPSGLRNLWGHTFVRSGIEEIEIPGCVTNIPPYCFKDCRQLRKVVCASGLKKLHPWAFGGCERLEKVMIGGTEISPETFLVKEREIQ